MSAPECESASLERIGQIVAGQATALGKHKQALAALFTEVQGISAQLGQVQNLLQSQGTFMFLGRFDHRLFPGVIPPPLRGNYGIGYGGLPWTAMSEPMW